MKLLRALRAAWSAFWSVMRPTSSAVPSNLRSPVDRPSDQYSLIWWCDRGIENRPKLNTLADWKAEIDRRKGQPGSHGQAYINGELRSHW